MESLLGLKLRIDTLHIEPCLPSDWDTFKIHYRYRETVYHITVTQVNESKTKKVVTVDGVKCENGAVNLIDDRQVHLVEVLFNANPSVH